MIQLTENQWMFFVSFAVLVLALSYFGGYAAAYHAAKAGFENEHWTDAITAVLVLVGVIALLLWIIAAFSLAVT